MIFRQLFDSVSGTYSYLLASRHGGVDTVFSNHYARVQPDDDPRAVIDH